MHRLALLLAAACSMSARGPSYTVAWPDDWVTTDLTRNAAVRGHYRDVISYEGGRPRGQTTLFQHAIIVSRSPVAEVLADIKKRQITGANAVLATESLEEVAGRSALTLGFHNRVDPTNQTTYHVIDAGEHRYVLHLHAPSTNAQLTRAASLLTSSFALTR